MTSLNTSVKNICKIVNTFEWIEFLGGVGSIKEGEDEYVLPDREFSGGLYFFTKVEFNITIIKIIINRAQTGSLAAIYGQALKDPWSSTKGIIYLISNMKKYQTKLIGLSTP